MDKKLRDLIQGAATMLAASTVALIAIALVQVVSCVRWLY